MSLLLHDRLAEVRVVPLANGMHRVTRSDGTVLGYLEQVEQPDAPQYRAKRMLRAGGPAADRFWVVGDYWSREDAIEALRRG
jgi:hypothetical protein